MFCENKSGSKHQLSWIQYYSVSMYVRSDSVTINIAASVFREIIVMSAKRKHGGKIYDNGDRRKGKTAIKTAEEKY